MDNQLGVKHEDGSVVGHCAWARGQLEKEVLRQNNIQYGVTPTKDTELEDQPEGDSAREEVEMTQQVDPKLKRVRGAAACGTSDSTGEGFQGTDGYRHCPLVSVGCVRGFNPTDLLDVINRFAGPQPLSLQIY